MWLFQKVVGKGRWEGWKISRSCQGSLKDVGSNDKSCTSGCWGIRNSTIKAEGQFESPGSRDINNNIALIQKSALLEVRINSMHSGILSSQSLWTWMHRKLMCLHFLLSLSWMYFNAYIISLMADEAALTTEGWGIQENYEKTTKSYVQLWKGVSHSTIILCFLIMLQPELLLLLGVDRVTSSNVYIFFLQGYRYIVFYERMCVILAVLQLLKYSSRKGQTNQGLNWD